MFSKASNPNITGTNRGDVIWAAANNINLKEWQPIV